MNAWETRNSTKDRLRHLHTWFDGFRTLRFVHDMRDRRYPNLPWREALANAPFVPYNGEPSDPREVLESMRRE